MGWTFYDSSGRKLNTASTLIDNLDIDGATDIGAAIVDADLFIIDDGAGGTNRKTAASRLKTYVEDAAGEVPIANLDIDGGTDIGAAIVDADLFIIDDGAGGTNRKTAASRLKTYIGTSGIAWEGSQTTETTSSSASSTDILTSSTVSIAQTAPFQLLVGGRKTDAGGAAWGGLGLKINSTVISVAATNTSSIWSTNQDDDRVSRGTGFHIFNARVTNYLASGTGVYTAYHASGIETATTGAANNNGADFPGATITAIIVSAVSVGGSNVMGADELQIYELATS
jgi:hypothetical protein